MNALKIFENSEFGMIRTIEENGNALFGGTDTAKALAMMKTESIYMTFSGWHSIERGTVS